MSGEPFFGRFPHLAGSYRPRPGDSGQVGGSLGAFAGGPRGALGAPGQIRRVPDLPQPKIKETGGFSGGTFNFVASVFALR